MVKTKAIAEFGDFQTPPDLAHQCCKLLKSRRPASVLEPTCGTGTFLQAAIAVFPHVKHVFGFDVNSAYIASARKTLPGNVSLRTADFFSTDWGSVFDGLPDPVLVIGNPPWVTNSQLAQLQSGNLPGKSNFHQYGGLDAITGKSNFDISEWMFLKLLDSLEGRDATIAMLCKTTVARKVLARLWKNGFPIASAELYRIDATSRFGAAVDGCFLVCTLSGTSRCTECAVFDSVDAPTREHTFGFRDGRMVADLSLYDRLKHLQGKSPYRWRSGIKHDAGRIMELTKEGPFFRNGLDEQVDLEPTYLYPMLKSSDIANGGTRQRQRFMLVPQRSVGDDTSVIRQNAPKTWRYLERHAGQLAKRASSVYRNRPRFSVFGVGEYSFAPWKVAISGFYKRLEFGVYGPRHNKPVVLDDTAYSLACNSRGEAEFLSSLLNSDTARDFYSAHVFWDAKRPITATVLRLLDLPALARELGKEETMAMSE